jgi:hypothetical protein
MKHNLEKRLKEQEEDAKPQAIPTLADPMKRVADH